MVIASSLARVRPTSGQLVRVQCPGTKWHGHVGQVIEVDIHHTAAAVALEFDGLQVRWFTIDSLRDEWIARLELVADAARAVLQKGPSQHLHLHHQLEGLAWIERHRR